MKEKEQSANVDKLQNAQIQEKGIEKPKTPIEKLKNGDEISPTEEQDILKTQLTKINKASQNSHHNIAEVSNLKLKLALDKSLSLWENNEIRQKISTGKEIKSMAFYLPQDLQDHKLSKFLQNEEKQCLIDSKSENALLEMTKNTPKQEALKVAEAPQKEEIVKELQQKKEEVMQEVQAENKGIGEQVGDFFKGLLEMILNLLKGFGNFLKPQKQEEKETVKKKEGISRVEGKFEGGKIQAIIGGKEIAFESENITPFSGRQEPHLDGIAETLVLVDDKKYIIKDGKVFDWNGTMNVLSNEIKVQCGEKEITQFNQSLKEVSKRGVENFNFRTFVTNTELLCCLIFLGEAKTNNFRETKIDRLRKVNEIFTKCYIPTETIADNITSEAMDKVIDTYKTRYYPMLKEYFTF